MRPGTKLLIHCKEGLNRSPSTAYAILQAWGTPAKDALEHVKEARPEAKLAYQKDADRAVKSLGYI
jgi:protein-tyrosine phosphatase